MRGQTHAGIIRRLLQNDCVKKKPLINKMSQMAAYCHILLVQIIRSTDLKSNKKLIFLINISLISQYHVS